MIKDIKKLLNLAASVVFGSLILWNCEPDADQLGSQFFQEGAQGTQTPYDLIAYNVFNGDSVRSDAARLQSATLGAFREPQFGLQKSGYVTQARLASYNPNFGTNAVLDSAVMVIKPQYAADSVKTTTLEDYVYPDGNVAAKKVVTSYPVVKYGKTKIGGKTTLNIKVREVTEFLYGNNIQIFSNKQVSTGAVIGSKEFKGDISAIKVTKDSDNSELFIRDAAIRIPMDAAFFQNKIIAKAGAPELSDAASFIRYFQGVQVTVDENDGYIFNFDPNSVVINLYYKNDKVANGTTTREAAVFQMDLGAANARFSQIAFDRANTPSAAVTLPQDTIKGESRLYGQGMGGPGFGLKIPEATVATIRDMYNTQKIGIISAKLRIYNDKSVWSNNYKKPSYFVVKQKNVNTYLEDMTALAYSPAYSLVKGFNLDKEDAYYEIGVTQTIKNIVEKQAPAKHFILNVGNYTTDASGTLLGLANAASAQNYNSRAYTPHRIVLVGTKAGAADGAKLILTYGKK